MKRTAPVSDEAALSILWHMNSFQFLFLLWHLPAIAQCEQLHPQELLPAFLSLIRLLAAKNTATATSAITKMFTQFAASQPIISTVLYFAVFAGLTRRYTSPARTSRAAISPITFTDPVKRRPN